MGSVTSTLDQTLPVYEGRSCSSKQGLLSREAVRALHTRWEHRLSACHYSLKGDPQRPQPTSESSSFVPLSVVNPRQSAQLLGPLSFPLFSSLRTSLGTEPEADKVDKESKVDKEFEWRENDTCQDMPWKTELLHASASLGKA